MPSKRSIMILSSLFLGVAAIIAGILLYNPTPKMPLVDPNRAENVLRPSQPDQGIIALIKPDHSVTYDSYTKAAAMLLSNQGGSLAPKARSDLWKSQRSCINSITKILSSMQSSPQNKTSEQSAAPLDKTKQAGVQNFCSQTPLAARNLLTMMVIESMWVHIEAGQLKLSNPKKQIRPLPGTLILDPKTINLAEKLAEQKYGVISDYPAFSRSQSKLIKQRNPQLQISQEDFYILRKTELRQQQAIRLQNFLIKKYRPKTICSAGWIVPACANGPQGQLPLIGGIYQGDIQNLARQGQFFDQNTGLPSQPLAPSR
jgi:hypothetical protein